jgi:Ca-activated chloride channel family protein
MPVSRLSFASALLALASGCAAWAPAVRAADAATNGPAVIVFDGSGSMWGTIGTERPSKFDLARAALRKSLSTVSPSVALGLMSFGQRRRADCSDVEVLAPPEAGPPERILSIVDKLNPKGKGPLSLAIKEAAKQIPAGQAGSVIVIHDGGDNCWQDPCAAATEIAKTNAKTQVYLIGFGLEKADVQRLQCVANATHGKVLEAADSASLETAIGDALTLADLARVDPATGAAVPVPKAAVPPAAAGAPGLRLSASLASSGPPLTTPLRWSIAKADAPEAPVRTAVAREVAMDLAPGSYVVEARYGQASARQTLTVSESSPTVARISLNAGILKIDARADRTGAPLAAPIVTVFAKADGASRPVWIGRDSGAEIVLPAGPYAVRVEDGLAEQTADVAIAEGARADVAPVLGTGQLELSAVAAASGQPLDEVVYVIAEDDPDQPQGKREVARSADPKARFTLAAGTYYIAARAGSAETHDRIALGSGAVIQHVASFNVVRLAVSAGEGSGGAPDASPARPIVIRVLADDDSHREVARANAAASEFQLPPGRYSVEALISGSSVRAAMPVDLSNGRDAKVQIKLDSGEVTVGGPGAGTGTWQVKDSGGRTVMHSGAGESATARLSPGRYVLVSDGGNGPAEQAFELKAGESRVLKVAVP